jgi:hypothetical protein
MRKSKHVFMKHDDYITFRQYLRVSMPDLAWQDSTSSVYVPSWAEHIHDASLCQDGRGSGELAFETIKLTYPDVKLRWVGHEMAMLDRKTPSMYSTPLENMWLGYVDLKSAYWTFYQRFFLDGKKPLKGLKYPMLPIAQALEFNKGARNAVMGICRSTHIKWCRGQVIKKVPKYNRYLSPLLWFQVIGCLQYVASVMHNTFKARYICTDSYIFADEKGYMGAMLWLADNGLEFHCHEANKANIWGWGSYQIGDKATKLQQTTSNPVYSLDLQAEDKSIFDYWRSKL